MTTFRVVGRDSQGNEWSIARNVPTEVDARLIAQMFTEDEKELLHVYRAEKE